MKLTKAWHHLLVPAGVVFDGGAAPTPSKSQATTTNKKQKKTHDATKHTTNNTNNGVIKQVTAVQFPRKMPAAQRSANVCASIRQEPTTQTIGVPLEIRKKKRIKNPMDIVEVDKVDNILDKNGKVPGQSLYAYTNWIDGDNKQMNESALVMGKERIIDIDDYQEIDATPTEKNNKFIIDSQTKEFIAGKITTANSNQDLGGRRTFQERRAIIDLLQVTTPTVKRGLNRKGFNTSYNLRGNRKNPHNNKVGQYSFNPKTSEEYKKKVDDGIRKIVCGMEKGAIRLIQDLSETAHYKKVKELLELDTVGETGDSIATQFSSGENYWSQAHTDDDVFFSTLSCMCKNGKDDKKVMYYFVFPEYKLKIPMKPGDIMVFNPLVLHSCSNCRVKDSHIFSAYVSKKTVVTTGMEKGLDKE